MSFCLLIQILEVSSLEFCFSRTKGLRQGLEINILISLLSVVQRLCFEKQGGGRRRTSQKTGVTQNSISIHKLVITPFHSSISLPENSGRNGHQISKMRGERCLSLDTGKCLWEKPETVKEMCKQSLDQNQLMSYCERQEREAY